MKYVYLFELDSVRKTDEEIVIGQQALYHEIVTNGNIVVLTYNQLIESKSFFSLLTDKNYYDNLVALFEKGAIKISQFDDTRTLAQYLIDSTVSEKEFIYSGWPLKSRQRKLLALIRRSLVYSDLSEIRGYIDRKRSDQNDQEIRSLFDEVTDPEKCETAKTLLSTKTCIDILEKLYWLLKIVLTLSPMHQIYIQPRDKDEYNQRAGFKKILDCILSFDKDDELWKKATNIIKNLDCFQAENKNRSSYHHALREPFEKPETTNPPDKEASQYAEAIIDLCYLYTCEISIRNVSKHYNVDEIYEGSGPFPTFQADFFSRLGQSWDLGHYDDRFLLPESNQFTKFEKTDEIPDLGKAVRVAGYLEEHDGKQGKTDNPEIYRYEYEISRQRKLRKNKLHKAVVGKLFSAFVCVLIVCLLSIGLQFLQSFAEHIICVEGIGWTIIETLFFLVLSELVTSLLAWLLRDKFPGMMSLSGALSGIVRYARDLFLYDKNANTYLNANLEGVDKTEELNNASQISYITTEALKKYKEIKKSECYQELFAESDIYPIADIDTCMPQLLELEELYGYHFGIVYKSKYHMLCVDPIVNQKGEYFPYERIIPVEGNGVVMVTMHNGNFVLLRQYRHAPRKEQIAFPRGFAESGMLSIENAKKELCEELHAKFELQKEPVYIGAISPDSGLTSTCANVFLIELSNYQANEGHEGIQGVIEMSTVQLGEWLRKNRTEKKDQAKSFDDGFTMAAYLLYLNYLHKS